MDKQEMIAIIKPAQFDEIINTLKGLQKDNEEIKKALSIAFNPNQLEILTTKQAMALLKLGHLNTFKRYIKKNGIKPISNSRPFRYNKADLIKN